MAQTSLIIGNRNWAVKEDSLLGYNVIQNNYLPIPIDCVRATTATRVNEQGLIEIVPRNLLQYSQEFENAYWQKDAGVTVDSNVANSPNGSLTADRINFSTSGISLYKVISAVSTHNSSIYLKGEGANIGKQITFEISGVGNSTVTLTSEWQRFETNASNCTAIGIKRLSGGQADSVLAWGIQLEQGSVATEYFPTTNRLDIPRIDYSTGTASLLVEPQRTNLLTYSEQFNDASWAVNATITPNTTISPDGTQDADTILGTGFIGKNILQSGIHTFSVFAKAGTSNEIRLNVFDGTTDRGVYYNLSNGTITSSYGTIIASNIVLYSNGWYRISITTNNATRSYVQIHMDSAQTCFIWGAQLEAGSYATSYIPTIASSVTRNADIISRTGISGLIGQTEGVLFVDFIYTNSTAEVIISINDWDVNSRVINISKSTSNRIAAQVFSSGANQFLSESGVIGVIGQRYKCALAYKANDFAFYINGNQIGTGATGSVPASIKMDFGRFNSGQSAYINFNSAELYKTRLTNAELAQLTTI